MFGQAWANTQYFNPKQIGGLVLWLDAADPSANGTVPADTTSVATWVDKSTKGNNATQATGANQPVFKTSGLNSKYSFLSTASTTMAVGTSGFPTGSGARTLFIVMQSSVATTGDEEPFGYGTTALGSFSCGIFLANLICAINTAFSTGNTSLSNNTPYVTELNYAAGGTLSTVAGKVNGTAQTMTVTGTNGTLNTNTNSPAVFRAIHGYCNEVLYYNSALSAAQATQVRRYLGNKWGITVS